MATPAISCEKIAAILEARKRGLTIERIAEECGVATGTASKVVRAGGPSSPPVVPPVAVSGRVETHLLLPDIHAPALHGATWRAMLSFLDQNRVDGVTFTGDQLDFAEISHWNKDRAGLRGKGAVRANLDDFNVRLDEIDARLRPGALKRWHDGNHERFVADLYESNPELEGMLDIHEHLRLKERGFEIFRLGQASKLGRLHVIHGDQVGSGKYVAFKAVDSYCRSIVMGHVHTASSFTKVGASDGSDKWMGWTLPTMGTTNPSFARNRPSAHTNGFAIVELTPRGQFNLYTVITDATDGSFAYAGRLYSGR